MSIDIDMNKVAQHLDSKLEQFKAIARDLGEKLHAEKQGIAAEDALLEECKAVLIEHQMHAGHKHKETTCPSCAAIAETMVRSTAILAKLEAIR